MKGDFATNELLLNITPITNLMKRRSFVKTTLVTGTAAVIMPSMSIAAKSPAAKKNAEFYEIRTYTLKDENQQKLVENYFETAAIPALNRIGVKNIGVFTELNPTAQTKLYAIIPYKSIEDFVNVAGKLEKDAVYKTAGGGYLMAPSSAPAYERIESSLLKAFAHMPAMEVPAKKARIFELRQYQSASESAGKKKIEMFNDKGEIDIFKRLGFKPVFFGETVIGELMPNLTYMVTFDDMEAHGKHWQSFGGDAEWKVISKVPEYADSLLVSKITATFIKPTAFSQI